MSDMTAQTFGSVANADESLIPYGVERQRALADEIAALPSVSDAAAILKAVRTEQRPVDTMIPVHEVRMRATDGGLHGLNCDPNSMARAPRRGPSRLCNPAPGRTRHAGVYVKT